MTQEMCIDTYLDGALLKGSEVMVASDPSADTVRAVQSFLRGATQPQPINQSYLTIGDLSSLSSTSLMTQIKAGSLLYLAVPIVAEARLLQLLDISTYDTTSTTTVVRPGQVMDLGEEAVRRRRDPLATSVMFDSPSAGAGAGRRGRR